MLFTFEFRGSLFLLGGFKSSWLLYLSFGGFENSCLFCLSFGIVTEYSAPTRLLVIQPGCPMVVSGIIVVSLRDSRSIDR